MDRKDNKIILYSPQAEAVWEAVERDGVAYSKREYVQKKYEESAGIFLAAYDAYIRMAEEIVPRPDSTNYPYWAFVSEEMLDGDGVCVIEWADIVADVLPDDAVAIQLEYGENEGERIAEFL